MSDRIVRREGVLSRAAWVLAGLLAAGVPGAVRGDEEADFARRAAPVLRKFCFDCHQGEAAEAKLDLAGLAAAPRFDARFPQWGQVVEVVQRRRMPPSEAPQPTDAERRDLAALVRGALDAAAARHAGDPGEIVLRRLTGAEFDYAVRDLTGLDLDLGAKFDNDAVGGEGFTNTGTVQFVQESSIEHYLEAARTVARHAVIGAGPLRFHADPGRTGLELSAIARINAIYRAHGFRSAAGEGGEPFGLDRLPRAFFAAWEHRHRARLGRAGESLADRARAAGLDVRFLEHVAKVVQEEGTAFPTSSILAQWNALPPPDGRDETTADVRRRCERLAQEVADWQRRFGSSASHSEETPLLTADAADLRIARAHDLVLQFAWPKGTRTVPIRVQVERVGQKADVSPLLIWKGARMRFRTDDLRRIEVPLTDLLAEQDRNTLGLGRAAGEVKIGRDDFVTRGLIDVQFDLPLPKGVIVAELLVTAGIDIAHGEDCAARASLRARTGRKHEPSVSVLLADAEGTALKTWRPTVVEFAARFPQVTHREAAPSDRDPIPDPFDDTYNERERDDFHQKVKYHRDDRFLVEHVLDDATRRELDQAWADLLVSFEHHDAFLRFVAKKYQVALPARTAEVTDATLAALPAEPRGFVEALRSGLRDAERLAREAEPGHVEEALKFAARAWRRPLAENERTDLRRFHETVRREAKLGHADGLEALLARILVSPEFLYRAEAEPRGAGVSPLSDRELAARLSFFLWSSLPDAELEQAAAAGRLSEPDELVRQTRRMLRDPRARRLASEFFGQWFGFYRFDAYRGIDPQRFPEFDDRLKEALHDEAVSFFEHLIRADRPAREILFADYAFLTARTARHYGIDPEKIGLNENDTVPVKVGDVAAHRRGGLLGLGAVLAVTSAPLRTSPVKRGDWVLRRLLGTPVPPPPADAGSIPASEAQFGGLTVRQKLESHRTQAACRNCHERIDPLGFALERFDPLGRWRDRYGEGQPVDDAGELRDGTKLVGPEGLKAHLAREEDSFRRTLCTKLLGYALGRRELLTDRPLLQQMQTDLRDGEGRFSTLVERIVTSRQFRHRRGREETASNAASSPGEAAIPKN